MICIETLSKNYGEKKAVDRLNLRIYKGEIFGFLGPNGAGKTTTIKMLTGLLDPTSGSIQLNGTNLWKNPLQAKKEIAYVPDQPHLYEKLTGREYLQFIASVYHLEMDELKKRKNNLANIFQMTEQLDDLIESYSHGMKQKLAIIGALIHDPKILFLDEPTVGLDPKSARMLKDLLQQKADQGMTVFLTTHILEIAEQMCDRVGILSRGKLIAIGTMEELRALDDKEERSLEDIFLQLTSDEVDQAIIDEISRDHEGEGT